MLIPLLHAANSLCIGGLAYAWFGIALFRRTVHPVPEYLQTSHDYPSNEVVSAGLTRETPVALIPLEASRYTWCKLFMLNSYMLKTQKLWYNYTSVIPTPQTTSKAGILDVAYHRVSGATRSDIMTLKHGLLHRTTSLHLQRLTFETWDFHPHHKYSS